MALTIQIDSKDDIIEKDADSRGRILLPSEVRDRWDIEPGDEVQIAILGTTDSDA